MSKPKIVYWDLETCHNPREIFKVIPSIGAWPGRTWKAQLGVIISFGYQIEGEKKIKCINAWDYPNWEINRFDDSVVCEAIMEVLHDADEIVTHNGKSYDFKYLNTRLMSHGMAPLHKTKHVDTKSICKSNMTLYSNSLSNAATFFGVEDKMQINNKWDLWYRIAFEEESKVDLKLMSDYCKQDIKVLREVYLKTRAFHGPATVNKNLYIDTTEHACPTCGSGNLIGHGTKKTKTRDKQRWLCKECGSTSETIIVKKKLKAVV